MEVILKRTLHGLQAVDKFNQELLEKYKLGDEIKCKISKPRNVLFHRKFFSLLNLAFENQDLTDKFDVFRKAVIIEAGFTQDCVRIGGEIATEAKSISFSKMDQAEFEDLYSKVLDVVIKILGVTEEEFENELMTYL